MNKDIVIISARNNTRLIEIYTRQLEGRISATAGLLLPEAGLHPSHHGRLLDTIRQSPLNMVVATHSEHLIMAIQVAVAKGQLRPSEVSLLVDDEKGGVEEIRLGDDGRFQSAWPGGFFGERRPLLLELLRAQD